MFYLRNKRCGIRRSWIKVGMQIEIHVYVTYYSALVHDPEIVLEVIFAQFFIIQHIAPDIHGPPTYRVPNP